MPIYEYVCQGCQRHFEVKQKMTDAPVSTCERCGAAVSKIISAPAIMFKGSGWYVTDYSDKLKPPGPTESAGKPSNGETETKKQEPAPATSPTPAQTGTTSGGDSSGASASSGTAPAAPSTPTPSSTTSKPSPAS